jgi:hypothetical protein
LQAAITIPERGSAFVITMHTTPTRTHGIHLRRLLDNAGAVAYLDVASYEQRRRANQREVIVESTGAGGR